MYFIIIFLKHSFRQARGRRGKKKGKGSGGKIGPKRIWFNLMTVSTNYYYTN